MELLVWVLAVAAKTLIQMLIIALMAIPAGFGLAVGYKLGKAFYGLFSNKRVEKNLNYVLVHPDGTVADPELEFFASSDYFD